MNIKQQISCQILKCQNTGLFMQSSCRITLVHTFNYISLRYIDDLTRGMCQVPWSTVHYCLRFTRGAAGASAGSLWQSFSNTSRQVSSASRWLKLRRLRRHRFHVMCSEQCWTWLTVFFSPSSLLPFTIDCSERSNGFGRAITNNVNDIVHAAALRLAEYARRAAYFTVIHSVTAGDPSVSRATSAFRLHLLHSETSEM